MNKRKVINKFNLKKQVDSSDCGPACLQMLFQFYKTKVSLNQIKRTINISKKGVSIKAIMDSCPPFGFRASVLKMGVYDLIEIFEEPLILHIKRSHYVILYGIDKKKKIFYISDPAIGKYKLKFTEFEQVFLNISFKKEYGLAILVEKVNDYSSNDNSNAPLNIWHYLKYYKPYKKILLIVFLSLFIGALFTFLLPILTKNLVDVGIVGKNLNMLNLIVLGQIVIFLSSKFLQYFQQWALLIVNTKIGISLVYDYLSSILKLPMRFFDSKTSGDLINRLSDHKRLESFISQVFFEWFFAIFNFLVFSAVLIMFSPKIFLIFIIGSTINSIWVLIFLKQRKILDHESFFLRSQNSTFLIDFFNNIREIKLFNVDKEKKSAWHGIQLKYFQVNRKALVINQAQSLGSNIIIRLNDILITYYAAILVIDGSITFGTLLAVQFIIGNLKGPVSFFVSSINKFQDLKISLERLSEINEWGEEFPLRSVSFSRPEETEKITIRLDCNNISFSYPNSNQEEKVIQDFNFSFTENKIYGISGNSGIGKSTLIKLILGFYEQYEGEIYLNDYNQKHSSIEEWRSNCSAILQGLNLFDGSILDNITLFKEDDINYSTINYYVDKLELKTFINGLPMGLNTFVGTDGQNLSEGQKQRILLIRLLYSDRLIYVLDEATNALHKTVEQSFFNELANVKMGKIIIVITHNKDVLEYCDEIVSL
jgi:ATP-binding cassette subfamily B protein